MSYLVTAWAIRLLLTVLIGFLLEAFRNQVNRMYEARGAMECFSTINPRDHIHGLRSAEDSFSASRMQIQEFVQWLSIHMSQKLTVVRAGSL